MDYTDVLSRAGWTGAQSALALLIVELGEVKLWWAVPLALSLSAAKSWLAGKLKASGA